MNKVIKHLYKRKTIRVFENKEISQEDKMTISKSNTIAPTVKNQRLYTILDITECLSKENIVVTT